MANLQSTTITGNVSAGATNTSYVGPAQYGGVMFPRGQILFSNTNTQNQLYLSSNAYTNAGGVFAYRNSSQPATYIGQDNGGISMGVAGNGTADNVISWTTGLEITNSGHVTLPNQPSFVAHKSSNQEPDSDTLLSYDIVTINRGGYYNASISRFTAPVTGIYAFGVKVWFKTNSTGTIWVHLRKNGAVFTEQRMSLPTAAGDFNTFFPKWVYGLSAGDYIEVSGYGNNSNFHSSQTERYSQFYGHLLH
jgi:hypothetical protein